MSKTWPSVPLSEVAAPIERPVVPVPGTTYRQIGVRLWGQGAYEREPLHGSETKYATLSRVETGDIIVNKIWARNGSVAVVADGLAGAYVSGEFPTFAPTRDRLEPRWFHWFTTTPSCWEQCDDKSRGTSGKNRIRPERFLQITIPLPPLDEQRRIVARIEALAAKIEEARGLRSRIIVEADALSPSLLTAAYDCAAEIAGRVERLDDLCVRVTDGTHITPSYVLEGIPFLSVKDISSGQIRFEEARLISHEEHASLTARCKPERDDVLLTKVGTTGFAKAIDTDREFSIFVSLALLKLDKSRLLPKFTEFMLNSSRLKEYSADGTRGVGNKNLVLKFIREFPMPAPPLLEQRRIVAYLDGLQAKVDALKRLQAETAAELDALLPSILDKAFKGEL